LRTCGGFYCTVGSSTILLYIIIDFLLHMQDSSGELSGGNMRVEACDFNKKLECRGVVRF